MNLCLNENFKWLSDHFYDKVFVNYETSKKKPNRTVGKQQQHYQAADLSACFLEPAYITNNATIVLN